MAISHQWSVLKKNKQTKNGQYIIYMNSKQKQSVTYINYSIHTVLTFVSD